MMGSIATLAILILGLIGHGGLVVGAYNRINATGIHRVTIKWIEKLILAFGILVPLVLIYVEQTHLLSILQWPPSTASIDFQCWNVVTKTYLLAMGLFAMVAAPFWIEARPYFSQASDRWFLEKSHLWRGEDSGALLRGDYIRGRAKLPRNEVTWTEANVKKLFFSALPPSLVGLKIAHLSDIHLTGQMENRFYWRAFDWLMSQSPDLIVIAGDIVDYDFALSDLEPVLRSLDAPLGKYFVLGNHDRRLSNPLKISDKLTELGWFDLGSRNQRLDFRHLSMELIGNELPWFQRAGSSHPMASPQRSESSGRWTLGVAHSPDQFSWGVKMQCDLLLCGHTHGGQIRFPFIGPIVAPSWNGSRYASGVFEKNGTLMHVSRGMSGIHPYRWGCPPEVSILELHSQTAAVQVPGFSPSAS